MESDYFRAPLRAVKKSSRRKLFFTKALRLFLFFGVIAIINVGIFLAYSDRHVGDQVYLQEESVSGMGEKEALAVVKKQIGMVAMKQVQLSDGEYSAQFALAEAGLEYDEQKTLTHLFTAGKSFWENVGLASLVGVGSMSQEGVRRVVVLPHVSLDEPILAEHVRAKLVGREYPPVNAELVWDSETGWSKKPGSMGRQLIEGEVERIVQGILDNVFDAQTLMTYAAEYENIPPSRGIESLEGILARVRAIEMVPVELVYEAKTQTVFVAAEAPSWFTLDYSNNTVSLNEEHLDEWISEFSALYNKEASTVTVVAMEEHKSTYQPGATYKKAVFAEGDVPQSGYRIKKGKLKEDFTLAIQSLTERKVVVEGETVPMTILSQVPGVEFPERISEGRSHYPTGSDYGNRVINVLNALRIQDMTIVAPEEVSSFNTVGGWVDYSTGYVDGQVIFGNQLVKVPGGGVCQTSTTLFRALTYGGLEILNARAHTWRVHYYDDWLGPNGEHQVGMDAAVFPPGRLDVSYKNTTPGHILVHSYADQDHQNVYFEIYGTSDGRKVELNPEIIEDVRIGRGSRVVRELIYTDAEGNVEARNRVATYQR